MTDWATALANRKRLGFTIGADGQNVGRQARTAAPRPAPTIPDPEFDQTWRATAACKGTDTNLFYNDHNDHQAITVCHTCPVMWPCRYDALEVPTIDQYGVAGGLTATMRRRMRRRWEWGQLDATVMRARKRDAHAVSVQLRQRQAAA